MRLLSVLFFSFSLSFGGNVGFVTNQKYLCINISGVVDGEIKQIMSHEDALKYPIRFYVDNNFVLYTDDRNYTEYKGHGNNLYINEKNNRMKNLIADDDGLFLTTFGDIQGEYVFLLYKCMETNNWTLW